MVPLVRAGGVLFFGGGVVFFAGAVFFGDGKVVFWSCASVAPLAGRCEGMKSIAVAQTISAEARRIWKEWLFLFIAYSSKQFGESTTNSLRNRDQNSKGY